MTPSARLQAVLDLLQEIDTIPRPADALVSAYFRARRYIGSKDRSSVSTMLYDALRHHARLSRWLEKVKTNITPRARLLAYVALILQFPVRDIAALCDGQKYSPAVLDDHERAWLHKLEGQSIEYSSMPDAVRVECPEWAAPLLKQHFGPEFVTELQAMLNPAPLDLRINVLKTTRDVILEQLKEIGIKAEPCALSPIGIRVVERPSLNALPMLKNGLVEIQDEGSQLVALMVDAHPGQRVADFCAGAGGKTLAIAAQMNNKGRITACDVLENRLKRSTERFRRADVHNIEVKPLKDENDPWVKHHKGEFDRVLVDAPCSGTGTWRRNPDQRWRSLGPGLEQLLPLQARILESASRLVKAGGRLVYATCSLLPQENEHQITAFLEKHPDFTVVPFHALWTEGPPSAHQDYLSLTPARHGTDGFFAAVLEKAKKETATPDDQETA